MNWTFIQMLQKPQMKWEKVLLWIGVMQKPENKGGIFHYKKNNGEWIIISHWNVHFYRTRNFESHIWHHNSTASRTQMVHGWSCFLPDDWPLITFPAWWLTPHHVSCMTGGRQERASPWEFHTLYSTDKNSRTVEKKRQRGKKNNWMHVYFLSLNMDPKLDSKARTRFYPV